MSRNPITDVTPLTPTIGIDLSGINKDLYDELISISNVIEHIYYEFMDNELTREQKQELLRSIISTKQYWNRVLKG